MNVPIETRPATTTAPLAPTAMHLPLPQPTWMKSEHYGDGEGFESISDLAWMAWFDHRNELTDGEGIGCREHGPARPFLGFRTVSTCAA
jgi:hypothetical protein